MNIGLLILHRFLKGAKCRCLIRPELRINITSRTIVERDIYVGTYSAMAQRSITSFFKITPPKTPEKSKADDKNSDQSPHNNGKEKRSSKRPRLDSSGSETETTKSVTPKDAPQNKKKSKRLRIDSSGSDTEVPTSEQVSSKSEKVVPKSEPVSPKVSVGSVSPSSGEPTPKSKAVSPKTNNKSSPKPLKVKVENADSPKTYASPKSKKGKRETKSSESPPAESKKVGREVINNGKPKEVKENIEVKTENDYKSEKVIPVAETEYNPSKLKYHPILDACWAAGRPVPYLALARTFAAIEPLSARLRIVDTLANYFRSVMALTPDDLLPSVYMCLNRLAPAYHSLELGIAETYLLKAVGQCTGRTLAQLRALAARAGDLGAAAEQARATQRTMFPQPPLLARSVFAALKDIAHMTGQASVNKKIAKIQSLYVACRHCEAKYLIRSLEGKLRIGLAEQSVLQALAAAAAAAAADSDSGTTPDQLKARVEEYASILKTTYCECPNYDAVIPALLAHGVPRLPAHCRLAVGVPLKPMLAQPARAVSEVFDRFEGSEFTCEWKYDGERAQIHVPGEEAPAFDRAAVYSRNQENNTSKYPDVVRRLPALLKPSVRNCVLDCEAVAYDPVAERILPFQVLATRKRKDAAEAAIKVQVCVFVFDLLFLNDRALVREPLAARRQLLRDHFLPVQGAWQFATWRDCSEPEQVQLFLEEAVRGCCEGLMVKTLTGPRAHYDIARRSRNWLKLKKDYLEGVGDTLDVVIIGAYWGRGKRRAGYGGFLAACRDADADCYQTLCKLGTGFSDEELATFTRELQEHLVPQPPPYYSFDGSVAADAWFLPAAVWEVRCADLSLSPAHRAAIGAVHPDKGISLRFPRFVRVRPDKSPEQASSARQVAALFLAQEQAAPAAHHADEFY